MTKKDDGQLFTVPKTSSKPGPVYQGVCKTIRALEKAEQLDRSVDAGSMAQARSIAASIDRVSGHNGGYQASGMQLAALHAQLSEVMVRLNPAGASDPFQEFLEQLDKEDGHGHPTASHPEV